MAQREGYKVVNAYGSPFYGDGTFRYAVGETVRLPDGVQPRCCHRGFHYCPVPLDCLRYVAWLPGHRLLRVKVPDGAVVDTDDGGRKCAASVLTVVDDVTHDVGRLLTGALLSDGVEGFWELYNGGLQPASGLWIVVRNLCRQKVWAPVTGPVVMAGYNNLYQDCDGSIRLSRAGAARWDDPLLTDKTDARWIELNALLDVVEPCETHNDDDDE
jgi:hypothetical protein